MLTTEPIGAQVAGLKRKLGTAVLLFAFLLTGVGTALLGAALPAMLGQWHLSDRSGGWLLFSSFAGATLGALLVQGSFRLIAAAGLGVSALATGLLSAPHHGPLWVAFLLFGTGLGMTMTAISLIQSREVPAHQSGLEMNRLNLCWAIGACCAPALALHSLRLVSVNTLFRAETVVFAGSAITLLAIRRAANVTPGSPTALTVRPEHLPPVGMWVFAAAAVGLESAIGGWLTTYTQRAAHGTGFAVWANSAFWSGLLLSRAAHSMRSTQYLRTRPGVAVHLAAVVVAAALLVFAPFEASLPAGALLAGLGLGPLYPLVLSISLPRYRSGVVFVMAGVGASLLPWLTGALSTSLQSLRAGLLVPCATVPILLASALWMRREIPASSQVPA